MKYYISLNDFCEPKIVGFNSKAKRDKFALNFLLKSQHDDDFSIFTLFEGNISFNDYKLYKPEEIKIG
jgi:hypothetical protein